MRSTLSKTSRRPAVINVPIALEQLADGLRRLSHSDLTTLELLVDTRAMRVIRQSLRDTKRGKVAPFRA